jgi:hypothetical protein
LSTKKKNKKEHKDDEDKEEEISNKYLNLCFKEIKKIEKQQIHLNACIRKDVKIRAGKKGKWNLENNTKNQQD